jgi:dienelactone hydrolase
MLDAQACLDYLRARQDVDSASLVVFGRSLGGAVALHLAADNQDAVRGWFVVARGLLTAGWEAVRGASC